jgi:hypothetical protein
MKGRNEKVEKTVIAAYSIPEAGAMVGLSRNGAYDAAKGRDSSSGIWS